MCRSNKCEKVNERLMVKLSEQAPGDLLVEKYLVEIAKSHNVSFKPDPEIAVRDPNFFYDNMHQKPESLSVNNTNNDDRNDGSNNSGGSGGGGAAAFNPPSIPIFPSAQAVSYIGFNNNSAPQPPSYKKEIPNNFDFPSVPNNLPSSNSGADSFDELNARFENLKKK